jgi:diguanylate cyclase (GGDEF)-like protein/PAS domain S-box-containing protein
MSNNAEKAREEALFLSTDLYQKDQRLISRIAMVAMLTWTLVICAFLYSTIALQYQQAHEHAKQKAVDHFNKELAFRLWSISKGGFYLQVSEHTRPIDYLSFLEHRDVLTADGKTLTLYDPVSALKGVISDFGSLYGVSGKIVGEAPFNPDARPDAWEARAIQAFQRGSKEVFEITRQGSQRFVRIMRPMQTRAGCIKCHGHLGHKVGEIRSGISLSVPLKEFTDSAFQASLVGALSHGSLWLLGVVGIMLGARKVQHNLKERHHHFAELELSGRVFDDGLQGILITDPEGTILRVNSMFSRITGYAADEVMGGNPSLLKSGHHKDAFYNALWHALHKDKFWVGQVWNRHKNGDLYLIRQNISSVLDDAGEVRFYISMFQDITEENESQERIFQLAHYDSLTKLPNRELFLDRAGMALEKARRYKGSLAVLYIDLDNFKVINDTLGHHAGDTLLMMASERLQSCVRKSDTLARLSGDEFAILLENYGHQSALEAIPGKILECFNEPFSIEQRDWYVGTSIGIGLFDESVAVVGDLLKNADAAMYFAKENGKHNYAFFDKAIAERSNQRMELLSQLRDAVRDEAFVFYYQPIIDVVSKRVVGVEALLRWQHQGKMVFPDLFIPLAEESGLIVSIGQLMLPKACKQVAALVEIGHADLKLFYNISSVELVQPDFVDRVNRALQQSALQPRCLEVEITETTVMAELAQISETLNVLRKIGVSLAIDDFGTGYSSLSYLKKLPINVLKIDRSFVGDTPSDKEDTAIVRTIISMAKTLGLQVVSEGVETREQLVFLEQEGSNFVQGYLLSRPLPYDQLIKLLEKEGKA